jgi:hypothetical protein
MIFLLYFGLPSIQRFQAREVMVVTGKRATGGIQAPAITILPMNPQTKLGWKKSSSNFTFPHLIRPFCENTTSRGVSIDGCIEENTYNRSEVVKDILLGYTTKKSLIEDDALWTKDFTDSALGRRYTLNIGTSIGPDDTTDQLFVAVGYDLNYKMILHDQLYFAVNTNPGAFPSIILDIQPNETKSYYYGLALTEIEELDIPKDPCKADQDYNFQACIKESLSRQVGCRTKWDRWSQTVRPLCNKLDQYR